MTSHLKSALDDGALNKSMYTLLYFSLPSGFCPGQTRWAGIRRNIHPLTLIVVINHPLSASYIYYDPWHSLCSIYMPDSLFPQSLSKFSLVYLLAWHPPPHHCLLFAAHAHTVLHCIVCQCFCSLLVTSVLLRRWLGGRQDIRPVKNWVVGCWHGYLPGVRCRFAYGPADTTATHCVLLQEFQIGFGFTFLVPAHPGSPGQNPYSRKTVVVVIPYYGTVCGK